MLGSFGYDLMQRFAPDFIDNALVAYGLSMLVSTLAVFLFLVAAYERLTNVRLTAPRGAGRARSSPPCSCRRRSRCCRSSSASRTRSSRVQALGASALLLVWLYVMANVIVFGAEVNWWYGRRDEDEVAGPGLEARSAARARCEFARFQSSPSSATVRSSPAGTKIGS